MTDFTLNNALWIAPETAGASSSPIIIKRFMVGSHDNAVLRITGLGYFEAYLNGMRLGDEYFIPPVSDYLRRDFSKITYPCRDEFTHRIYYHTFDVSEYLIPGENTLTVRLGGGWFTQNERVAEGNMAFGDRCMCIFALSSGNEVILSDGSEKWIDSEIRESSLFLGETVDARFSDTDEKNVAVVPTPESELTPADGAPDRLIRTLTPTLIGEHGKKSVYDAGEFVSGFVKVTTHAKKGEKITITFSEDINDDGSLNTASTGSDYVCSSGRHQVMSDTFITDGSEREFSPKFVWHAFRYFEITGSTDSVTVCVIHADTPSVSSFSSDSDELNFLYDAYIRTQLSNMHGSIPSDCPHRERLGYTGDGQICAPSAMLMLDSRSFYRKWIRDILDCQDKKTGHIQHTAPFQGGGGGPGGWGCAVFFVPWAYYKQYGDKEILGLTYDAMMKNVGYLESRCEGGLVVREEEGGWCLGDWCCLEGGRVPESFVNTAYLVKSLEITAECAGILGFADDVHKLDELHGIHLDALRQAYAASDKNGGTMVYAVWVGLEDVGELDKYYSSLGHYDTGFLATDILTELLFVNGYAETAVKLLTAHGLGSFSHMKEHGASTLWEEWSGSGSHAHPMFGACTRQLFSGILGLRQCKESCGWASFSAEPVLPRGLSRASGSIVTPHGRISVSLTRENDMVKAEIDVPDGVSAVFRHDGEARELRSGVNVISF